MTTSLAFLARHLVKMGGEGRLPHGIGLARLFDTSVQWGASVVHAWTDGLDGLPSKLTTGPVITEDVLTD
jgi:hypothetical protein